MVNLLPFGVFAAGTRLQTQNRDLTESYARYIPKPLPTSGDQGSLSWVEFGVGDPLYTSSTSSASITTFDL
jgi:hypothetical protein